MSTLVHFLGSNHPLSAKAVLNGTTNPASIDKYLNSLLLFYIVPEHPVKPFGI